MVGNLFNKALAFFTIPIFTRLLTTSEYGIAQTYLSWVSILTLIVGLSLGNSIRTAYVDFTMTLKVICHQFLVCHYSVFLYHQL